MCGRFCVAANPGEISERYGVEIPSEYRPRYNIAPAQKILVIREDVDQRNAQMVEWGFQIGTMDRIINARIETVHEKPMFKKLYDEYRCLIPASGYYEWKHEGGIKLPFYFTSESGNLISFAGLIRPSHEGEQVAILTTAAVTPYSEIHDRMPVILGSDDDISYLSVGEVYQNPPMRMYQVSSRVNQWAIDDPDLILPERQTQKQKTLSDIF